MVSIKFVSFAVMAMVASVSASNHVVDVINNCGGPTTIQLPGHGNFYSPGSRTFSGDVNGGIAQACSDINGVGCTSVEFSLNDGVSSADITLIPPHKFNHPASFTLNNGETGATCSNANCGPSNAFYTSTDYQAQRQVNGPNSNIQITFC